MPAVPTPPTIRDGITPSSTWNQFRDSINFLLTPPIAKLRQTVAQTLTSGVITPITFDAEIVDSDVDGVGGHSNSVNPSRFVCRYPGWYGLAGRPAYQNTATGSRMGSLAVNSVELAGARFFIEASVCDFLPMTVSEAYLNTGDYAELFAFHTNVATLDTEVGSADSQSVLNVWFLSR